MRPRASNAPWRLAGKRNRPCPPRPDRAPPLPRGDPGHLCRSLHPQRPDHPGHHPLFAPGIRGGQRRLFPHPGHHRPGQHHFGAHQRFPLSAVATNLKVKGGGDYYLISRTLGLEFGRRHRHRSLSGPIGLHRLLRHGVRRGGGPHAPLAPGPAPWVALVAVAALFVLAWLWRGLGHPGFSSVSWPCCSPPCSPLSPAPPPIGSRALMGAELAGTVRRTGLLDSFRPLLSGGHRIHPGGEACPGTCATPGKSLPLGTFAAVGVSILVYFGVAVLFAGAMTNADLSADYGAMRRLARVPALVDAGVIAATLSSAMASFLGAPRILQSLAGDRIFGFPSPPLPKGWARPATPGAGSCSAAPSPWPRWSWAI